MKFTEDFNNYIRNLSPADRERELERVGYYAAGHGRPRRPGRTSVQGFPAPPRNLDPFSYAESMGSSMANEAGAQFQNMASGSYASYAEPRNNAQPAQTPISEFRNDKEQALSAGMQRFGMSADALRNIAKTVGIRRLDSSNDLKMIQDHFDKHPPKDKGPGNRGISTIDVFGPGPGFRDGYKDKGPGNRGISTIDVFGPGRSTYGSDSSGQQGGLRPVMSPEQLGIAGYGRPKKNKGNGQRGISTLDVFGGRRRGARDRARSYIK